MRLKVLFYLNNTQDITSIHSPYNSYQSMITKEESYQNLDFIVYTYIYIVLFNVIFSDFQNNPRLRFYERTKVRREDFFVIKISRRRFNVGKPNNCILTFKQTQNKEIKKTVV